MQVANLGQESVTLELLNFLPWLEARWRHGAGTRVSVNGTGADLELVARHDFLEDQTLAGSLQLIAESLDGEKSVSGIEVRLATHRSQALGNYGFQGFPEPPKPFDFGTLDIAASGPEVIDSYVLSFQSRTSVPLRVSFSHLPAWLVFEVDGFQRRGPAAGRFFEREAPFQVDIRPVRNFHFLGLQRDRLLMETDDARPDFQRVEIEMTARVESSKPYVTVSPLEPVHVSLQEIHWAEVELMNWGLSPALLSLKSVGAGLQVQARPVVPAFQDGQPGQAALRIRISPRQLTPGSSSSSLALRVENGEPREITVPIPVRVDPVEEAVPPIVLKPRKLRPEIAVVMVFLLLLLLVLLLFSSGVFSN